MFDLDGTLTDPEVGIVACLETGMRSVGVDPADHGDLARFIGPPLQETFASFGLDAADVDNAIQAYRERFATHGMFENEVYPGIVDLLQRLKDAGWVLAVATSKPELFAVRILMHFKLAEWFVGIAGATMDGSRRSKADVVAHALELVGHPDPTTVVMIGDRSHDVLGARAHNVRTIGVTWGYGGLDELIAADAWRLANGPEEIPELLGIS